MIDLSDFNPDLVEHSVIDNDPRINYRFRSRVIGWREWSCVTCGHQNRQRVEASTFVLRCLNEDCRVTRGFGDVYYLLDPGPKVAPPDLIIPSYLREAFPQGDLGRWSSGQPIHRVAVLRWPEAKPR